MNISIKSNGSRQFCQISIKNDAGEADYVLLDSKGFPLCAIEAKRSAKSPLVGKEQARGYAESLNCRFIILSNCVSPYELIRTQQKDLKEIMKSYVSKR